MSRAVWLGATRIGVAVAVLGTGALVRANVASSPSEPAAEGAAAPPTTVALPDATAPDAAAPEGAIETGDDTDLASGATDSASGTSVFVAAPVPPTQAPTIETAAPSHVRSVSSVWLEGDDTELHLRAAVANPCGAEVKVEENSTVIYVYVYEHSSSVPACTLADDGELTARLDGPLGERVVVDAVSGEQFVIGLIDPATAG